MSLQEFDAVMDRMKLAFEYAESLGQYVEAAKILFQMNEQLADDLKITIDELEDPKLAKSCVMQYNNAIKSAVAEHRQRLF